MQPVLAPRTTRARRSPTVAAVVALIAIPTALALAFVWAPTNVIALGNGHAQQDWPQKIFYLHVPVAFAAYWAFFVGAWNAVLYFVRGDLDYDTRSYVGVHVGVTFGTLVLITGSLWAKVEWGTWWQWGDRQLVVFLILYLFYAAYFMLRFSIDAGRQRAAACAAFTILGAALVPLSFFAIRIANTLIHPIVITDHGLQMTTSMAVTFLVSSVGFIALATAMIQLEVAAKLLAARGWVTRRPAQAPTHAPRATPPSSEPAEPANEGATVYG